MATGPEATFRRRLRARRATGGSASRLLELASTVPPPPRGIVRRSELAESLAEASAAQLALIVAPPGYGKSTLLAEWAEHDERLFVWLALTDTMPATISASTPLSPCGDRDDLAQLVRALRTRDSGFVVVLDDAHRVEPAVLREVVQAALSEVPVGSTIALASRTEPAIPIGGLRAHRRLSEIRMPQLAMSAAQAAALLREAGIDPEFEEVQTLLSRTEGWPAALYLAALALREDPDGLAGFGGDHHLMSEYLRDEVLAALPEDLVSFAVRTSVLDELSGPICDAMLERRGSATVLGQLARANPLLIAVDPAHHRYRWHGLMNEALRAELTRIEPELEPVLRLRASGWYSACGDTQRAIDQTAGAGDPTLTGDLLWRNVLSYLTSGQSDLVHRWLSNFCADRLADHAPLALSASLSALLAGNMQDARHWSLAASAALERSKRRKPPRSLATGLAVVGAISGHDGVGRMGEIAISAAEGEPEDSLWRPLCLLLGGVASYLQGDREAAERVLDEGIRLSGNSAPSVGALCLAQRAMLAIEREDWELASDLTDCATIVVEEWTLTDDPLCAFVFAAAAASRAHQGRIDEAKGDLRRGIDLLAALGDFVPWYGAEARILLAHASLSLADAVGARTLLAEASRFARRIPDAAIFAQWFDHAWAYMDTLAETTLAGPSSLTIAELRILRFLPSHRSFREIASQLGVSANTVKTQAHAVYRKLGAASRSEAVSQAIEAGLLGR
jgi:LuxR family transcriptional regulator, maltose regulon positive regulatory protein